ncbi:polymer-forming cytoskeletal protein [Histophilus somni]|uniref:polymer-forming cytoskeletal protein n=1 Tax=Histophilus somni TaxID=731 RepID=UPI002117224C|nr:polymer-forming cytoskeletal protein [Histophilus somni]
MKIGGVTLYRIKALRRFGVVEPGDLGGYVESEYNLSHWGDAWVFNNAKVYDKAKVNSNATVHENATVCGAAMVCGDATVRECSYVGGTATVDSNAVISGDAKINGMAKISGYAQISGDVCVSDNAWVGGMVIAFANAKIGGSVHLYGKVYLGNHANIKREEDLFVACYVGSEQGTLTVYRTDKGLFAIRGCFCGTVEELLKRSKENHNEKTHNEYKLLVEVARSRILN